MREICSSGSVRGGDGNVPTYSAQRMGANPKLPGIVGDNHRVANQTMMANGAPYAGLGKWPDYVPVENVDTIFSQIGEKRACRKPLRRPRLPSTRWHFHALLTL